MIMSVLGNMLSSSTKDASNLDDYVHVDSAKIDLWIILCQSENLVLFFSSAGL